MRPFEGNKGLIISAWGFSGEKKAITRLKLLFHKTIPPNRLTSLIPWHHGNAYLQSIPFRWNLIPVCTIRAADPSNVARRR